MIKKRFRKIFRLTILIAARQIWKLLCNLYQLLNQPFLTIKTLLKERDKSQIFLLSLMAIMPAIFYVSARLVWDRYRYGFVLNSVGMVFLVVSTIELIIFTYLGFWLFKCLFKK
ncbi:MAG: hypothetical protein WCG91_01190 [Candidatus Shapirobacteria bacterium]